MFSCFGVWSFVVVLLCTSKTLGVSLAPTGSAGPDLNVITWDDLLLPGQSEADQETNDGARVIVVDPNGGGDASTVKAAIEMVPEHNKERVKIHVRPGTYKEKVLIPASKPYISLIGDPKNPSEAVIAWHDKASDSGPDGAELGTFGSATFAVEADYFCATGITFQNTVVTPSGGKEGYQAVALMASGDKSVFYKVRFIGSQDTLLDSKGSHYFYKCFIEGATDFIAGNGRSLYDQCSISVVSPGGAIAAQKRDTDGEDTGFSFVSCTVTGDGTSPFLGRAWGQYSRTVYLSCKLNIDVMSGAWNDWGDESRQKTAVFGEYQCSGKGSSTGRVPWAKKLSSADAEQFSGKSFIRGQDWLKL